MKTNGVLKVEHGIPIPARGGHAVSGYMQKALKAMKKGDSVFVAAVSPSNLYTQGKQYLGKGRFVVRKVEGGFRLWRTK